MKALTASPTHIALYGNVQILRGLCPECKSTALIISNEYACCGTPFEGCRPRTYKRLVEPQAVRRKITVNQRRSLLNQQDNRCFYCDRRFGDVARHLSKKRKEVLKVQWDHKVPWKYSQNNHITNYVAACHQCNALKYARVFQTVDEARVYLQTEIERRYKTL